jgi:hypothetical protein
MKQMAMVLEFQKPKQNDRKGEVVEGLPGSIKSAGWVKRDIRELGSPNSFLGVRGKGSRPKDR